MKKKKRSSTPKRKRLNKKQRISSVGNWLKTYNGKNIVKGYSKWFGVDLLSAIAELRIAGIDVSIDYEEKIRKTRLEKNNQSKPKKEHSETDRDPKSDWDEEFEFIAGYTSNGVPYGIRKGE